MGKGASFWCCAEQEVNVADATADVTCSPDGGGALQSGLAICFCLFTV
jgi:hypothetical protein